MNRIVQDNGGTRRTGRRPRGPRARAAVGRSKARMTDSMQALIDQWHRETEAQLEVARSPGMPISAIYQAEALAHQAKRHADDLAAVLRESEPEPTP